MGKVKWTFVSLAYPCFHLSALSADGQRLSEGGAFVLLPSRCQIDLWPRPHLHHPLPRELQLLDASLHLHWLPAWNEGNNKQILKKKKKFFAAFFLSFDESHCAWWRWCCCRSRSLWTTLSCSEPNPLNCRAEAKAHHNDAIWSVKTHDSKIIN